MASFKTNVASPDDFGLRVPLANVGITGTGVWGSCSFVRVAVKITAASPMVLEPRSTRVAKRATRG